MYSLPTVIGDTPADRNRSRSHLTREQLEEAHASLLLAAAKVKAMLDAVSDEEDWGADDEVNPSIRVGRADFVGRNINAASHRVKEADDAMLAAAILAGGYEVTEG